MKCWHEYKPELPWNVSTQSEWPHVLLTYNHMQTLQELHNSDWNVCEPQETLSFIYDAERIYPKAETISWLKNKFF